MERYQHGWFQVQMTADDPVGAKPASRGTCGPEGTDSLGAG